MIHDGVRPSSIQETGAQARLTTTRASKTVRQLAPSDREVAVVTPPSPQLPPSMVRLTALVIRSPVIGRGHAMAAVARRATPVNASRMSTARDTPVHQEANVRTSRQYG